MANELTELTKTKKDLMKGLHFVYGFNFQKPYRVAKVCTPTTIGAMKRAVAADKTDTVVALVPHSRYHSSRNDIYAVEFDSYYPQGFDVSRAREISRYGISSVNSFDNYYEKKDFTESRQRYNKSIIVVAQSREFQFSYSNPDKFKMRRQYFISCQNEPWNIRHKIIEVEDRSYGTVIKYRCMDANRISNPDYVTAYPDDNETVTDLIDKSGYLIKAYRNDLTRRVREHKAEIKKAEFLKMDYSHRITTLREVISTRQNALADALRFASTSKALEEVRDDLSYWHGLLDIMRDFEEFADKVENKSFASIEECDALYNRILKCAVNGRQ